MKLVFATHNQNKFKEVKALMPSYIELLSLSHIGCNDEIPETAKTLQENAQIKADFVTKKYGINSFADDTGLIVDTLNGAPGVYSARYAGEQKNANNNMDKLLAELLDKDNRQARFETIIALNIEDKSILFRGIAKGEITQKKRGKAGFGYDPIFKPLSFDKTFAELPFVIKNKISHRGKAIQKLVHYLNKIK